MHKNEEELREKAIFDCVHVLEKTIEAKQSSEELIVYS